MIKKVKKKCLICSKQNLYEFIRFGRVALAGSFLKKKNDFLKEKKYPLSLAFCTNCKSTQVLKNINTNIFFKDYFYASSQIKTLSNHFKDFANELLKIINKSDNKSILEIGCNDGILLKNLNNKIFKKMVGIDPAKNIINKIKLNRVKLINDFFSYKISKKIKNSFGKFSLIVASNVFAHSHKIVDITKGIHNLLDKDGVFIFEVHYSKNIILKNQFDMIYHEHVFNYSLSSLKKLLNICKLKIFDVKFVKTHGGSIRIYSCKNENNAHKTKNVVSKILHSEKNLGLNDLKKYNDFNKTMVLNSLKYQKTLQQMKKQNLKIAGYGASGRANTVLQYCKIGKYLDYMIDDSKYKIGNYTPGTHLKIYSNKILYTKKRPDIVIIFAWSFKDEVIKKNINFIKKGGKFLLLLPKIKIISTAK
jgi:hypothetical protein